VGKIGNDHPSNPEGINENGGFVISRLQFFNRPLRDLLEFGIYPVPTINCWAIVVCPFRDRILKPIVFLKTILADPSLHLDQLRHAIVHHRRIRFRLKVKPGRFLRANPDDLKRSRCQHPREFALALANGQDMIFLAIAQRDDREFALLIILFDILIFIK
jgi:hypothetical protein